MADADSFVDGNSDLDHDPSAMDADVEDDDTQLAGARVRDKVMAKRVAEYQRMLYDHLPSDDSDFEYDQGSAGDSAAARKKSKKKKRGKSSQQVEPSSGDSDNQVEEIDDGEEPGTSGTANGEPGIINPADMSNLAMPVGKLQQLQKAMELLKVTQQQQGAPKSMEEAKKKAYAFWDTQPVPKIDEDVSENTYIEADKTSEEVRHDPYSLPAGFHWDTLDINDPFVLKELYTLLNENYVEDDDNMFRFDYSREFLMWALQPPGWLKEWHCGVRVQKSKKLIGFISAVPAHIKVYDKVQKMVEINFLCVHKKLRSKRVAPVLIREITRRVNCQGIFQAVYTAGVVLPKPVSSCRYWHRSLNPRKLIEVKFSHLSRNMTMQRTLKLYKLPDKPKTPGFRACKKADIPQTFELLAKYLQEFALAPAFTVEEFEHWFLPREGIVNSYVVEQGGVITDFVSFYTLPSTVMHHPVHKSLKAAYSFYNVASKTNRMELMNDCLVQAKNEGFDVFNALDLMHNKEFLEKLKFGVGDGNLQYYLYNWRCPAMKPEQVGLVLQ